MESDADPWSVAVVGDWIEHLEQCPSCLGSGLALCAMGYYLSGEVVRVRSSTEAIRAIRAAPSPRSPPVARGAPEPATPASRTPRGPAPTRDALNGPELSG
ncbi:MAG: hypothetical protein ACREC5_03255 [Thermoplasmata archaeon]